MRALRSEALAAARLSHRNDESLLAGMRPADTESDPFVNLGVFSAVSSHTPIEAATQPDMDGAVCLLR